METIMTRRSVRKYTDQPVPDELVTQLLRAAMAAPSAGNQQPWQFVVVRDREVLKAIAATSPYAGMTAHAQVAVVVCLERARETHAGFGVEDLSACTENVLLAAHALGLGAVWLGFYPVENRVAALGRVLALPENIVPFSVIPVGYPAEKPAPADRFDASRIHLDRW